MPRATANNRKKIKARNTPQDEKTPKDGESSEEDAPEPVSEAAAAEAQKQRAATLKDEGNKSFTAGNWLEALKHFSAAIELVPTDHVFFSNRSGTNLKLLRTRDAVEDAEECVRLSPSWPKGYSRLGAALLADKQGAAAREAYEKGLRVEPSNALMIEGLAAAKAAAEEEEAARAKEAAAEAATAPVTVASPEETTVIGIDLGTTFSCVGVWRNGAVEIIEDESGNRTTPSFVAFTEDGGRLVGDAAKTQAARNATNTLYDIKRILGQKMKEPKVREEVKRFPFEVVADPDTDDPRIVVAALDGKQMPPEQVSALVLGHLKLLAENRLGHPIKKAVVTVPAYFHDAQRQATKAAGAIAGLDVLRIINEPTAAALAYGLDKKAMGESMDGANVVIYDLGGGTFDVSVLRIEDGMFEVKATGGDTHLGGEDFDNAVVEHLANVMKEKHEMDPRGDAKLMRKLRSAVEKAKRALSSGTSTQVEVEDISLELTRAKFEALNSATFDKTLDTVKKVLKDAKLQPADIDDVVLIGGSTRIPKIQEMLSAAFGNRQLCRSINPDEAVAYGAAVQGAILSGVRNEITNQLVLIDVTPLSLGIETEGKHMSVIIPRNTSIPCKKTDVFTTTENYQDSIEIPVYEGERPCTDGNRLLGEFSIHNVERAKRGEPQVDVTFALDANGILNVSAKDRKTGAKADCRIEGACKGLDSAEIARMVKEADQFKREDEEYSKNSELRHELEDLAYELQDKFNGAGADGRKVKECLEWLENITSLGKSSVRRAMERWMEELRAI